MFKVTTCLAKNRIWLCWRDKPSDSNTIQSNLPLVHSILFSSALNKNVFDPQSSSAVSNVGWRHLKGREKKWILHWAARQGVVIMSPGMTHWWHLFDRSNDHAEQLKPLVSSSFAAVRLFRNFITNTVLPRYNGLIAQWVENGTIFIIDRPRTFWHIKYHTGAHHQSN